MINDTLAPPPADDAALPFSRWRRLGFAASAAMMTLTAGALAWNGLVLGLDFAGGVLVEARGPVFDAGALRAALAAAGLPEAQVQLAEAGAVALIRAPADDAAAIEAVRMALGDGATIRSAEVVGPKVSGELLRSGVLASLSAVSAIGLYIWLRFEAKFGVAAFLTTLHDLVAMVGFYAVTGLSFDLTSVAALLAIAGYSINDTVVIFDRVRELLTKRRDLDLADVMDRAATSTLRRTLMTSGTTLIASVALMLFGGPVLFGFAAAITFGVTVGTGSSVFVAAPLLLHMPGRTPGRDAPDDQAPDFTTEED
jgi:preprotein translocase subunit SecF